jgi:putative effector of murein hydrolase LrgA (UPF0299 family)
MCKSAEIGIDSLDLSLEARASSLIRHMLLLMLPRKVKFLFSNDGHSTFHPIKPTFSTIAKL